MFDARNIAKDFIGIPYILHGRTLQGLDCYGLIVKMFELKGIKLFDINEEYDEHWSWQGRNYFVENAHRQWTRIEIPEPWDVVTFHLKGDVVNHAGIVLGDGQFIHTVIKAGTVISRLNDPIWKKKFVNYYRYTDDKN